jgi:uncharacterized protein (DUF1800 family)
MSRLITFTAPLLSAGLLLLGPAPTLSGQDRRMARDQDAAREQTADQQVRHVLNRLAFGPRPGDYDKVRAMGVDAWIDQQLRPARSDDAAVTSFLSKLPTLAMSPTQLYEAYPPPGQLQQQMARAAERGVPYDSAAYRRQLQEGRRLTAELQAARVGRAVASERQLEEVLTDFWLNHFSVFAGKSAQMRYYLADYENNAIRPHVLGNFRDLLGAVAKHPAMLQYLDNFQSTADTGRPVLGRPAAQALAARRRQQVLQQNPLLANNVGNRRGLNENYARELMELHTLGVDGGYTQQDVINVARAFTGWTIRPPQLARGGNADGFFLFNPLNHDAGEKRVLGVTLKAGRGIEDGEQVLDIVAAHPSTARYISHKLAVRLVSDEPPADLVERAAAEFTRTKGDLRAVVRTIVTSPEFFSAEAYRAKVKSPFELVVSALRATGAAPDASPQTALLIATLGQPVFGRETPDGWPETGDEWINTGAILNRINFGMAMAAGRVPGVQARNWPLMQQLAAQPREAQVDGVVRELLGGEVSSETRKVLVEGNNPLTARLAAGDAAGNTMGGNAMGAAGAGAAARRRAAGAVPPDVSGLDPQQLQQALAGRAFQNLPPLQGLQQIVGLAFGSAEFQRR